MTTGIYQIINKNNGKSYIGQSINIENRRRNHFHLLRKNKNHNARLQNSFNKHGSSSFEFKLLIICEKEYLTFFEQFFVDTLKPEFNFERECVDSLKGYVPTDEHRKNLSKSHMGQIAWNKGLEGLGKGKKLSEQTKAKMSQKTTERFLKMKKKEKDEYVEKCKEVWKNRKNSGYLKEGHFANNKITKEQALKIRENYIKDNPVKKMKYYREVGCKYGVGLDTIRKLIKGKTWSNI